jgi:hypothetical protein
MSERLTEEEARRLIAEKRAKTIDECEAIARAYAERKPDFSLQRGAGFDIADAIAALNGKGEAK